MTLKLITCCVLSGLERDKVARGIKWQAQVEEKERTIAKLQVLILNDTTAGPH